MQGNKFNQDLDKQHLILTSLGINLNKKIKNKSQNFQFYSGRKKEFEKLLQILSCKNKNNIFIVGEAGVGKTTFVEFFANQINKNLIPSHLTNSYIIQINLLNLITLLKNKEDFENQITDFINFFEKNSNIILFIDNIHLLNSLLSNSVDSSSIELINFLKILLLNNTTNKFKIICTILKSEYLKIEKDSFIESNFQFLFLEELSTKETIELITLKKYELEIFHNILFDSQAIQTAVELSNKYISDKFLPQKALDLLDTTAAKQTIFLNTKKQDILVELINSILNTISKLKGEAFKQRNITLEYLLNELEIIFENFLIFWIKNPLLFFKFNTNKISSPVSLKFLKLLKLTTLEFLDDFLLNFNSIPKKLTKEQNFIIYKNFIYNYKLKLKKILTYYKIINYLLISWLKNKKFNKNINILFYNFLIKKEKIILNLNFFKHIQIKFFISFLKKIKPLINKNIFTILLKNSHINLTIENKNLLYSFLGYYTINKNNLILLNLKNSLINNLFINKFKITEKEIRDTLSTICNIPLTNILNDESKQLLNLEQKLHNRVIGQEEAISAIAKAIRRARLGMQNPNRPIASFLFCGPTGVGKTEITKALAYQMFGSDKNMIRFDMSEFMEKFAISRLIGAPPGYIGYEEGGELTNAVREKPYSIVLLDEIEKAHPDVLNILLQVLEDGRLTDSKKRLITFENTILILTSNAASENIQNYFNQNKNNFKNTNLESKNQLKNDSSISFLSSLTQKNFFNDLKYLIFTEINQKINKNISIENNKINLQNFKKYILKKLTNIFLPEFLNRLDDIIIFQPLQKEELLQICHLMIENISLRVKKKNINLVVMPKVITKLIEEGYNPRFGARPLRRLVTKYIEDTISEYLLKNINYNKINKLNLIINLDSNNNIIITNK